MDSRITRIAAAPSVNELELAAVIVPLRRSNTGFSLASLAASMSARMMLSCETGPLGVWTVMISSLSKPACVAALAFWWLRIENSSWEAREMPKFCAISSACSPIVMPVKRSVSAGGEGSRSIGLTLPNSLSSAKPLAFWSFSRLSMTRFL